MPNGEVKHIRFVSRAMRNSTGELEFYGVVMDVTAQRLAQQSLESALQKLRHSEAYLAEEQRLSRTGSFGWNVVTRELVWSDETFCILV